MANTALLETIAGELRDARVTKQCEHNDMRRQIRATINSYFSAADLRAIADEIEAEWESQTEQQG